MSRVFKPIGWLIYVIFWGLILSVAAEWMGMFFGWWSEPNHAQVMLYTEIDYLNVNFQTAAFWIMAFQSKAYYYIFEYTGLEYVLGVFGDVTGLNNYVIAAFNTIQVFFVRVFILVFSMLSFVIFAFVGIASGLAMRDLGRYGGGRLFGFVYHNAKALAPVLWISACVLYLSIPFSVHPNAVLLPFAAITGINCMIIAATYKKYL